MDDDQKRAIFDELQASGLLSAGQRLRQPGDLDSKDLAAHLGVGERWAFSKMNKLANDHPEQWECLLVYDPARKHQLLVLRKRESTPSQHPSSEK